MELKPQSKLRRTIKGLPFFPFIRGCYRAATAPIRGYHSIINGHRLNGCKQALLAVKQAHTGERCFIIGNGPSLTVADLEILKNEICFGSHRIYEIFKQTDWRPTYYCAQDRRLLLDSADEISDMAVQPKFIALVKSLHYPKIRGATYLQMLCEEFWPDLPKFSEDISKRMYEGFTVTYMCLQMAAYMGFREIYLLGVDHNYSIMIDENGQMVKQENIQDHFSKNDKILNMPHLEYSTLAYKAAKQYADTHGIKIYNATRGGKLEMFERVNFDDIFNRESEK